MQLARLARPDGEEVITGAEHADRYVSQGCTLIELFDDSQDPMEAVHPEDGLLEPAAEPAVVADLPTASSPKTKGSN
jgi:hypothetical protein